MTNSPAPTWRPDRLPSDVRRVAEEAARRAGLPLALWLGRFIREVSTAEWIAAAGAPPAPPDPAPRQPIPTAAQAVLTMLAANLKHEDFPPLDEARAYFRLMSEFRLDADRIGAAVDRPAVHVVRAVRLLGLPAGVRQLIERRSLSAAHAHVLAEARDPAGLALAIMGQGLSVDEARRHRDGTRRGA